MGLNLTGANIAFFLEIYWQPGVIWQAEERMHRPGQKSGVLNLFPLMTDFESRYVLRVFDKINNIKRIVDGGISDDVDDNSLLAEIANEYGIPIGALM
jgi:SWI/SNF-related matrix-associated actin-dependent regulator 1 of chromatin subfamily A